jgi:hypothetical protein
LTTVSYDSFEYFRHNGKIGAVAAFDPALTPSLLGIYLHFPGLALGLKAQKP